MFYFASWFEYVLLKMLLDTPISASGLVRQ